MFQTSSLFLTILGLSLIFFSKTVYIRWCSHIYVATFKKSEQLQFRFKSLNVFLQVIEIARYCRLLAQQNISIMKNYKNICFFSKLLEIIPKVPKKKESWAIIISLEKANKNFLLSRCVLYVWIHIFYCDTWHLLSLEKAKQWLPRWKYEMGRDNIFLLVFWLSPLNIWNNNIIMR